RHIRKRLPDELDGQVKRQWDTQDIDVSHKTLYALPFNRERLTPLQLDDLKRPCRKHFVNPSLFLLYNLRSYYNLDLRQRLSPPSEQLVKRAPKHDWEDCYEEAIHILAGVRPDMYSLNRTEELIDIIAQEKPLMKPEWVGAFSEVEAQIYQILIAEEKIPKDFLREVKTKITTRRRWIPNSAEWRKHWRTYLDNEEKNLSVRYFNWEDNWMKLHEVAL
ncbi:hypothetical protein CSKR_203775, partial [Clonorchis sinensis]